jgi:uncharacterized protein YjbI with pentapeptide repeats
VQFSQELSGVNLSNANFAGANFVAFLNPANLTGIDLSNANLTSANPTGVTATECPSDFCFGADFNGANLTDANATRLVRPASTVVNVADDGVLLPLSTNSSGNGTRCRRPVPRHWQSRQ